MEESLSKIGKYDVTGVLGRGAMGVVYKARDPEIGREVAIKTLRALPTGQQSNADAALERFRAEARSAGNLRHPNIITIFEVNRQDDIPYMVMDYIVGEGLDSLIQKHGRLEPALALKCLSQAAAGLDYAHSRGVIHRDIKPGNLFLDTNGVLYILDFGVALITESISAGGGEAGIVVGSPGYMSPEQILNRPLDARSDLFSLAAVAFECFCGKRPFAGDTFSAVVSNILSGKPRALTQLVPELPLALEAELERGLAKEAEKRFPSATVMVEAFSLALGISLSVKRLSGEVPKAARQRKPSVWNSFQGWKEEASAGKDTPAPQEKETPSQVGGKPEAESIKTPSPSLPAAQGEALTQVTKEYESPEMRPRLSSSGLESGLREKIRRAEVKRRKAVAVISGILIAAGLGIILLLVSGVLQENGKPAPIEPQALQFDAPPPGVPVQTLSDREVIGAVLGKGADEASAIEAIREGQRRGLLQLSQACTLALKSPSFQVRSEAARMIGEIGGRDAVGPLIEALDDVEPSVRGFAARALGNIGDSRVIDILKAAEEKEAVKEVKAAMSKAVSRLGG